MQEYEQFRSIISDLKFKLQSEDYLAWKRCLVEYEKEKAKFIATAGKIKATFFGLVQNLMSKGLDAAQQDAELQKLLQQFESQFTPTVESFKSNLQNLLETIQDENKRKTWWSSIKTSTVSTSSDGSSTRTSFTETKSGGGQSGSVLGAVRSAAGGILGASASAVSKSASFVSSKLGGGQGDSNGQYGESNDDSYGQSGGYSSHSVQASHSRAYGSSGSFESQQRSGLSGDSDDNGSQSDNDGSGQSGLGISSTSKHVKKEESSYSKSGYDGIAVSKHEKKEETLYQGGSLDDNDGTDDSGSQSGYGVSSSKEEGFSVSRSGSKKRMCECT